MSDVYAYFAEENGQLVLHDPVALGVISVIAQHNRGVAYKNCQTIYDQNSERIEYFRRRFDEKGYLPSRHCIVIIQVDDPHGTVISNKLMPGYDWQSIRDQGLEPIARGIADRNYIQCAISLFDEKAADDLKMIDGLAVVVIADLVARVFAV